MNSDEMTGLIGKELLIYKPRMTSPSHEFRLGEKCVGKLVFPKAFGTLAEVNIFGREWTFKRVGFMRPMITIRMPGSQADLLRIPVSGFWGGVLMLPYPDGRLYELRMAGFWNPRRIWVKDQRILMEFAKGSGFKKYAVVRFIEEDPEIPLLVALGAYCLVMQDWDDAAAVAATSAAIG